MNIKSIKIVLIGLLSVLLTVGCCQKANAGWLSDSNAVPPEPKTNESQPKSIFILQEYSDKMIDGTSLTITLFCVHGSLFMNTITNGNSSSSQTVPTPRTFDTDCSYR